MCRVIVPISAAVLLAFAAPTAMADSPPVPPTKTEFRSQNGRFLAVSDPDSELTTIYDLSAPGGKRTKRWSMFGWMRVAELANDGDHLLILFGGLNLLPLDYDRSNPILYFVRRGELVKTFSVRDVVRQESNLRRTVSHYSWCLQWSVDESDRFRVELHDGSVFFIQLITGATGFEPSPPRKS